jgi:hypothetical protein
VGASAAVRLSCAWRPAPQPRDSWARAPLLVTDVGTCSQVQGDPTGVCSNVNRVLAREGGNSSVNLASQGHYAGVFIGI